MHKRLVALPGRQAAEHRRGGGREVVSISRVEGRTGEWGDNEVFPSPHIRTKMTPPRALTTSENRKNLPPRLEKRAERRPGKKPCAARAGRASAS